MSSVPISNSNGDVNYDGVVNGSDYRLMDNAFNTQGAAIASAVALTTAEIATPTAQLFGSAGISVPEPATLGVLVIGTIGSLGRPVRRLDGQRFTQPSH
jgi:hypothetical protein